MNAVHGLCPGHEYWLELTMSGTYGTQPMDRQIRKVDRWAEPEKTHSRIPPTIHEIHAGSLGQVQSDAARFQANEENCYVDGVH